MINIAVVGCGNWASKIINEINIHNKFNLTSIVCRKKKENIPKTIIFDSIDKMINSKINDSIYVAAEPKLNLEIIKLIKINNGYKTIPKSTSAGTNNGSPIAPK